MFGNFMRFGAFLVTMLFAVTAMAGQAHMKIGGLTTQPIGHHTFCRALPDECKPHQNMSVKPHVLTKAVWADMVALNTRVNSTIEPLTDQEIWGINELWSYPKTVGDCEDYVLLKRHALMQAGIHPSNLLITVVRQPNGDGHAVLTVHTNRGDLILDNLTDKVKLWHETPYTYLKRQSPSHAGRWVNILTQRPS